MKKENKNLEKGVLTLWGGVGLEATRAIRQNVGPNQHTPILAMTANVLKGTRDACLSAGMNDYLTKPAKPTVMKQMLLRYLTTD